MHSRIDSAIAFRMARVIPIAIDRCLRFLPLLLLCAFAGCASTASMRVDGAHQPDPADGVNFGQFNQLPRSRLGGLPYPGAFTFFEPVEPDSLGKHSYAGGGSERDRGMIYTCRGGFIDIAHVRKTIDLCKYAQLRFELALLNDWSAFRIQSREPSSYTVHLRYPPYWSALAPAEKQRLARELSIRLGQRMGILMVTWHEVLTWYGYRASALFPEEQSAFTYDDTGAHAFGVTVAGRALRDPRDWNEAVTDAMNRTLSEMHAKGRRETQLAAERMENVWWRGFEPLKRQVESGLDRPIDAWLVPQLPFCPGAAPYRYTLPTTDNVLGRDFRGLVRIEIEPNVAQADQIRRAAGGASVIDVDKHLPLILHQIRAAAR